MRPEEKPKQGAPLVATTEALEQPKLIGCARDLFAFRSGCQMEPWVPDALMLAGWLPRGLRKKVEGTSA